MAEQQSEHRRNLESRRLEATNQVEARGQIFAFLIASSAILGGAYLISIGKDASGLTAIIGALGTLAGVFVYSRRQAASERAAKRRPIETPEPEEMEEQLPLPLDTRETQ